MYIYELHESKSSKAPKPRNFVAKNAPKAGAGAHKDKKKAAKQGDVKHKGKVAEGSLEEYGDTAKGQKMLTKVQKRAVDRVVSKKADTDPKYAKKNQDTANRAWDRMTDVDEGLKDPKDNPCWKGYKPVGTKKKNGKTVPNCVPKESVRETATPGATSAGSVATVVSPHLAIGKPNKSYTGSPGKSGTKAPNAPKVKMQKPSDNALNMKTNIFGEGNAIKR